jgi:hypothetical protein
MRVSTRWIAAAFAAAVVVAAACGKPPKQAEVPDVDKGSGVDMAGEEAAPKPASSTSAEASASEADMRAKCCAACKEGLSKDRTGAAPNAIPCADFTAQLSPWCLEHFRAHPTMAADCK